MFSQPGALPGPALERAHRPGAPARHGPGPPQRRRRRRRVDGSSPSPVLRDPHSHDHPRRRDVLPSVRVALPVAVQLPHRRETTGRAVVVDPQRDISGYIEDAATHGLRIERVIETHFHADFLSGHLELAAATGAVDLLRRCGRAEFPIDPLADGQRLELGDVVLEIRHTPGHTPESISVVVWEHADDQQPWGVLTGDALFVGDVGRPDLLAAVGWSADGLGPPAVPLASRPAPHAARLDPGLPRPRAGSACGKSMSDAVSSTIGEQRQLNYALRPMSEDDFVTVVTEGQSVAPLYFGFTADSNRRSRELLDDTEAPVELDFDGVARCAREGALLIDARCPGGVRVRTPARFGQRRPRRPFRRVRRRRRPSRPTDRPHRRRHPGDRGQGAPGPHRLRPGARRVDRRRAGARRASRAVPACRPARRRRPRRVAGRGAGAADRRRPQSQRTTSRDRSPARSPCRWPRLLERSGELDRRAPPSSTARAATAPRSPRHCSARSASIRSLTCREATRRGRRPVCRPRR